jgi:rhamnose transport system substrate-binding protein
LNHTSAGRIAALLGAAAIALSACSSSGATTAPSAAASAAAPSVAASVAASAPASAGASAPASAAAGPITVGYLPKDIVNQYFAAAKTGVDKAAGELGGTVTQVGPNEAKADLQIPFITDLTTQGVNAIIISADGKDEVAPALKDAMAKGIKVVGFDSSPAVGAYNVFVNQVDFSGVGVNLADWACELAPSCTGDIAILSAAATATNQNAWIDLMKTTLAGDSKYAGLKLVDTVYGDDDATKSTQQAQALLTKYPNLKVIVAPTTVGILAAAQVVSQAGKSDSVKVTGLGFPNDMKPYVKDGTSPVFGLWSVPDLGYLSYQVADKLVKGEITGAEGETFTVPSLNGGQPYTIGKDSTVILGPAFRFDSTNVDQFNF